MKFEFLVHRAHQTTVSRLVDVEGEQVSAPIPALEVELVSTKQGSGTYTHRFLGSEIEEAKTKFVEGTTVVLEG
jgi:hypothetical protein